MLKSILTLSFASFLLVACNFSDKPGEPKVAPVLGKVEKTRSSAMFAYKNYSNIKSIYLVGTTNDWDQTADPFDYNEKNDTWELDVELASGIYQYKFLIHYKNGSEDWVLDPNNPITMFDGQYTNSAIYIGPLGNKAKFKEEADHLFSTSINDKKVDSVYISGSFNNWDKSKDDEYKLTYNEVTEQWEIRLTLVPGVYEYKFIGYKKNTNKIYGWYNDPKTPFKDLLPDGYGSLKDRIVISPWEMEPVSKADVYYCNDDNSIIGVSMRVVDTLNYEMPTELYTFYMRFNGENGCWEKNKILLPNGRYEYKFVVTTARGEERWIHDPNSNSLEVVVDKFEEGALNSLLTVGPAVPEKFDFSFDASAFDNVVQVFLVGDFNGWEEDSLDPMNYNPKTKKWELTKKLTRGKYGYKFRLHRSNESSFRDPLYENDPSSREPREADDYGYHSILTVH